VGKAIKIIISIVWDFLDIAKLIPFAGTIIEIFGSILAFILWGKAGLWYFVIELLPDLIGIFFPPMYVIGRLSAFVPTMTLIGIFSKSY